MPRGLILVLAVSLAGCGWEQPVDLPPQQSASLRPAGARLSALYDGSCRVCHTQPASGAPMTGNRRQWDPRWRKGLPALTANTVAGIGGMPAGGQCTTCGIADYEALIRFMAGRDR